MAILIVNTSQDVIVVYIGIPFNGLASPNLYVCPNKDPDFQVNGLMFVAVVAVIVW